MACCFLAGLVVLGPGTAEAQTLDSENVRLLSPDPINGGCLLFPGGPNPGEATAALAAICNAPGDGGSSAGGNSGSSLSAGATVENRREARLEEPEQATGGGALSTFLSFDYDSLERDVTTFEDGYDSDVWRATGGVDYRLREDLLVGAFFTYTNNQGDFDAGGDFETRSFSPTLFASYLPLENAFVDLALGYTRHDYARDRFASFDSLLGQNVTNSVSGLASSDVKGNQFSLSASAGYDFTFGGITVGPRVGLNYADTNIDGYTEKGTTGLELRFAKQSVTSLQTNVGMQASMAINGGFGSVLPQLDVSYGHEFDNDQRHIRVNYAGDLRASPTRFAFENERPDRNFVNIGAGAVMVLKGGIQPFVSFRALVGHEYFDSYTGTIGLRYELQ